jgi:hypothetical protein
MAVSVSVTYSWRMLRTSRALRWAESAGDSPSHTGHASGARTTGMRSCSSAHSEADLDILGPERHQPPAHDIERALPVRSRRTISIGSVGATFQLGAKLGVGRIRRDREHQLDFTDIGGQANATAHGPQYGPETGAGAGRAYNALALNSFREISIAHCVCLGAFSSPEPA